MTAIDDADPGAGMGRKNEASRRHADAPLPEVGWLLARNPSAIQCQDMFGSVCSRKKQACNECEVIDEKPEFRLVPCPMRWPVKRECEEQQYAAANSAASEKYAPVRKQAIRESSKRAAIRARNLGSGKPGVAI
jgi:hypothetical protein